MSQYHDNQYSTEINRLLKFLFVGSTGTMITLSLLYILTEFAGLWYPISLAIGWMVGFLNNFFWNRKWTFKVEKGKVYEQMSIYLICTLVALATNEMITIFLTEIGRIWYFLSSVIGTGFSTIVNFGLVRTFALNPDKQFE
ncbi:MAG: GtrA family protein [Candidatus Hodarchaeota archaeon]